MKPVLNELKRQHNTGPWLGGLKDLASRTVMYLSLLSFIQISATFYYTTLKPPMLIYFPWLNFWIYILILGCLILTIMLIEYKFIIPSSFSFLNKQEYLHQNLIRKDIEELKIMVGELSKLIEEKRSNETRNNSSSINTK